MLLEFFLTAEFCIGAGYDPRHRGDAVSGGGERDGDVIRGDVPRCVGVGVCGCGAYRFGVECSARGGIVGDDVGGGGGW